MKTIESFHTKCQRRILEISLHDFVRNNSILCQTGLRTVEMPYSVMRQGYQTALRHTRPCYAKSSSQAAELRTQLGSVRPVVRVASGPISCAATTTFPQRHSGDKLSVEVTRQRRYSHSKLTSRWRRRRRKWLAYGWCGQVYKLLMPNFSRTKNVENWLIFDRVTQNQTGRENFGTHCSKKRISDKLWTSEDKARCSKLKVSFWHYL